MCVCVCVSVTAVTTDGILAKIKNVKMTFSDFDICHSTMVLRDLDYIFVCKYFKN